MLKVEDCRRHYAEEIRFSANLTSAALIEAFARVPRERFLGPGPWTIAIPNAMTGSVSYIVTPDADPQHIYHNVLVTLDRSLDLSNGHPGTLAYFINALDLAPGERVYHLGSGSGYYTAIISEIVGPGGSVLASEVHPKLGKLAQQSLSDRKNVSFHVHDGMQLDPGECDAMLINAGVTHPLPLWLSRIRPSGRIVLPITVPVRPNIGHGIMIKITRQANGYSAGLLSTVGIYSATSGRDPQLEVLLNKALAAGRMQKLKSIRQDTHEIEANCIVHGSGICFSLAELSTIAIN